MYDRVDLERVRAREDDFSTLEAEEEKLRVADHFHYWNRSSTVGLKIVASQHHKSSREQSRLGRK